MVASSGESLTTLGCSIYGVNYCLIRFLFVQQCQSGKTFRGFVSYKGQALVFHGELYREMSVALVELRRSLEWSLDWSPELRIFQIFLTHMHHQTNKLGYVVFTFRG